MQYLRPKNGPRRDKIGSVGQFCLLITMVLTFFDKRDQEYMKKKYQRWVKIDENEAFFMCSSMIFQKMPISS